MNSTPNVSHENPVTELSWISTQLFVALVAVAFTWKYVSPLTVTAPDELSVQPAPTAVAGAEYVRSGPKRGRPARLDVLRRISVPPPSKTDPSGRVPATPVAPWNFCDPAKTAFASPMIYSSNDSGGGIKRKPPALRGRKRCMPGRNPDDLRPHIYPGRSVGHIERAQCRPSARARWRGIGQHISAGHWSPTP